MKSLYIYRIVKIWFKYSLALVFHYTGLNQWLIKKGRSDYILMLHRISDHSDVLNISIKLKNLAEVIKWCNEVGLITHMDDFVRKDSEHTQFAITFDDGYESVIRVLELPQNVPMTVYLSTGFIDTQRSFWATYLESLLMSNSIQSLDLTHFNLGCYSLNSYRQRRNAILILNKKMKQLHPDKIQAVMDELEDKYDTKIDNEFLNWNQVRELSKAGVVIGSHTHNHAITSRLTKKDFEHEIAMSHNLIEQQLGEAVGHFAYPNGQTQDIADFCHDVLKKACFNTAVTTIEGANSEYENPYMLKRFNVSNERIENPWGQPSKAMFTSMLINPLGIY